MTTTRSKNRRILVIDDNEAIHNDMTKALESRSGNNTPGSATASFLGLDVPSASFVDKISYKIDSAYQGQEGLQKVQEALANKCPYALAFVDMRMPPGWDGLETIEHLWKEDADLQVVICSAYSDYAWSDLVDRLGVNDRLLILKKPFDIIEIRQMALAMTEKWNLAQQVRTSINNLKNHVEERTADLQATNHKLQIIIDTVQDGIVFYDSSGQCEFANPMIRNLIDCDLEKSQSLFDWFEVLRPNQEQSVTDFDTQSIKVLAHDQEIQFTTGSDENKTLLVNTMFVPYRQKQRYLSVIQDITQKKAMEQHLVIASRMESIGQLGAGIAHEINTPIQYIGDNTQFLKEGLDSFIGAVQRFQNLVDPSSLIKDTEQYFTELQTILNDIDYAYLCEQIPLAISHNLEGIKRVSDIVSAIKNFSYPSNNDKQLVDLKKSIETTAILCRNEWKYVANLVTEFDSTLGPVLCISGKLNQVLLNLIINAAHAIAEGINPEKREKGTITIRTFNKGSWCEIHISDTGTGIPKSIHHRVFDPFFTTKQVGQGTGQGLAISHRIIVDSHGGQLYFESQEGQGTTFVIRLPVSPSESE